jgi:hypothetical protein
MKFITEVEDRPEVIEKFFWILDSENLNSLQVDERENQFVRDMVLVYKNTPSKGYRTRKPDETLLSMHGTSIVADRGIFLLREVDRSAYIGPQRKPAMTFKYTIFLEESPPPIYKTLDRLPRQELNEASGNINTGLKEILKDDAVRGASKVMQF